MRTKAEIVKEFGKSEADTGSTEVQIALLTKNINKGDKFIPLFF